MKTLSDTQAQAVTAFMECFDLHTTGAWQKIEEAMRDDFGIDNPESALEDARDALS